MYFFFFNDTATTEIYTLSLHDALPISSWTRARRDRGSRCPARRAVRMSEEIPGRETRVLDKQRLRTFLLGTAADRKSTRLNSSHANISYAVFCLKKKKKT